jgi:hypothetical protein
MYQPAGFRLPARTRGRVIPIDLKRRGLGDAASDYAAIAAKLAPGSAMAQLFQGCAANPTAPACASATQGALSTPYLTGADYQATVNSIAAGAGPAPLTATTFTGAPAGTSLPPTIVSRVMDQGSAPPPSVVVTPTVTAPPVPPVQTVQPAGTPPAPGTQTTTDTSVGFFSTTVLGIPIWIWGAAAVGAYFFFFSGGKHGRY